MWSRFFYLFCLLFMFTFFAHAEMIDVFRANLKEQCSDEVSTKATNLVLGIIKARKRAENPCNDAVVKDITSKCKKGGCDFVVKIYSEVFDNSGKVMGK